MDEVVFFIKTYFLSIFSLKTFVTIFLSAYFRNMGLALLSSQAVTILEQVILRLDSTYVFRAEVFITRSLGQATVSFIVCYIAGILRKEKTDEF